MYTIIYYSPTGNTKYLADVLALQLKSHGVTIYALEFTDPNLLSKNKHLILMYPIHGFNAPKTVKRFVKKLPEALFDKVSLIAVGCNTLWLNAAVSLDLRKKLVSKKYKIMVDEILAMPLTIVMSFPDDVKSKIISDSTQSIINLSQLIINDIESQNKIPLKSKLINTIGKVESVATRFFGLELHAKKGCTSCSLCWNNCPEKNIKPNKKNIPKFGFKCSMCMRCIYNCPEKVITPYISKFIPIKKGYHIDGF